MQTRTFVGSRDSTFTDDDDTKIRQISRPGYVKTTRTYPDGVILLDEQFWEGGDATDIPTRTVVVVRHRYQNVCLQLYLPTFSESGLLDRNTVEFYWAPGSNYSVDDAAAMCVCLKRAVPFAKQYQSDFDVRAGNRREERDARLKAALEAAEENTKKKNKAKEEERQPAAEKKKKARKNPV